MNANAKAVRLDQIDAINPAELTEGDTFLVRLLDWSMCEPFNRDDLLKIRKSSAPVFLKPCVVLQDDRLYACYLQEKDGTIQILFTGNEEILDADPERFLFLGPVTGVIRG